MSHQLEMLERAAQMEFFEAEGYLKVDQLIQEEELDWYLDIYNRFISGDIDAGDQRSDLSGSGEERELITQIMRPSLLHPELAQSPLYIRVLEIARSLMGPDMDIDFDMLINKAPHTNKETPWHQDAAYWIDMQDKRAVSCWVALDEAKLENGCMWYVSESHKKNLRTHLQVGDGGALKCGAQESEGTAVPLKPGEAALHQGETLHYSRGNSTDGNRRAIIINCRPAAMIQYERDQGFDHLGGRTIRNQD
jgi:phytanoyl-CoA hydroxylase